MGKFITELWGDTLAVQSANRLDGDDEPQLCGIASVDKRISSDGHAFIKTTMEIRPGCEPSEIKEVQKMLLDYVTKKLE